MHGDLPVVRHSPKHSPTLAEYVTSPGLTNEGRGTHTTGARGPAGRPHPA